MGKEALCAKELHSSWNVVFKIHSFSWTFRDIFFTNAARPTAMVPVLHWARPGPGPGTYIMQKTTHASCSMRTGFVKICLCEHSRYFLLVEIPPQFPLTPITYFHVMIQFLWIWLWFCRTYLYSILLIRKWNPNQISRMLFTAQVFVDDDSFHLSMT